ncbi:MAG: LytR/AlgR family response regulator transcription factor [Candidatus Kapaibacteriota bacterium]
MRVHSAKPLNVLLVEDDDIQRKLTRRFLKSRCAEIVGEISEASSVKDAASLLRLKQFDLLLLDISIRGGKSFDILPCQSAETLPYKVVFLTCHADLAIQGYDYHAADFIPKPIDYERLQKTISRIAVEQSSPATATAAAIKLPCGNKKTRRVVLNTIMYCRAEGKYSMAVLENGDELPIWLAFKELSRLLPGDSFSQIHRSYIINTAYVQSYSLRCRKACVTLQDTLQTQLPLGSAFRDMRLSTM